MSVYLNSRDNQWDFKKYYYELMYSETFDVFQIIALANLTEVQIFYLWAVEVNSSRHLNTFESFLLIYKIFHAHLVFPAAYLKFASSPKIPCFFQ